MSRKFMSLMFAGVVVSSANVQAVDYSVFPVVDALIYQNMKALSAEIYLDSMKDVLTNSLHFELEENNANSDVSISDLASNVQHSNIEKTSKVGE